MNNLVTKKIKSLSEMGPICRKLKKKGKSIVHCHGVFDLVHPGHIRHLQSAKKEGDVLIVSITKDKHVKRGPGRPIFNENLRAETLASLTFTDYICSVDYPTAIEAIEAIEPHKYVKGQDYKNRSKDVTGKIYDEEAAVKRGGGRIVFTDDITFSSSHLINQHLDVYDADTVKYLKVIARKYPIDYVLDLINKLSGMRVLVVGDAIIDQYHYCRPMNKSSKEPIVVNKYLSEESFAGGALATANHSAQFIKKLQLVTVLGEARSYESFIRKQLNKGIKPKFYSRKDSPTTIKRRFVGQESKQKFFEVCYMDDEHLSAKEENRVNAFIKKNIKQYDLVIVNDFGHGMLTPKIIKSICSGAKYLALNVQTNSANLGFNLVTKYKRADFVCIDELEMRLASHDRFSELEPLVKRMASQMNCKQMAVTRGMKGSICYSKSQGFHRAPAFSYKIVDKVGAGDAFFAFTAPLFASGANQDITSFIGNAVGSLAVQIVGNREPVKKADLIKFITRLLKI